MGDWINIMAWRRRLWKLNWQSWGSIPKTTREGSTSKRNCCKILASWRKTWTAQHPTQGGGRRCWTRIPIFSKSSSSTRRSCECSTLTTPPRSTIPSSTSIRNKAFIYVIALSSLPPPPFLLPTKRKEQKIRSCGKHGRAAKCNDAKLGTFRSGCCQLGHRRRRWMASKHRYHCLIESPLINVKIFKSKLNWGSMKLAFVSITLMGMLYKHCQWKYWSQTWELFLLDIETK